MKKKGYHSNQPGVAHAVSEFDNPKNKPVMGKGPATNKSYPPKKNIEAAGREMKANPPAILARTGKKFGKKAARKQKVAIMLNKARKGK